MHCVMVGRFDVLHELSSLVGENPTHVSAAGKEKFRYYNIHNETQSDSIE